ncbi:MAG TPA: kelch repeat-containing protein [Holophagaceae bacterium]|nr:kelch repeat-containing protein [Holophagaceae bacterium]
MRSRLLLVFLTLLTLLGCSKSEDGGSIPIIVEFLPSRAHVNPGGSTLLVANFLGGTATVDQGVGPITSGVPVTVSPTETTTYTLTLVGSKGDVALAKATVTVGARSLDITPAQVSLAGAQTQAFTAVTTGLSDTRVKWFAEQGSIDDTGLHTSPNRSTSYWVSATSVEDPTLCAKALVTVTRAPIFLSIESPGPTASLRPGESMTVLYTIFNATNPAVAFSSTFGSISAGGVYTAPLRVGTGTITLQSVEDPTVTAVIDVTVPTMVLPQSQTVAPGATFAFRAVCLGLPNPAVTWSVNAGGSMSPDGVFTSDGSTGFFTVSASTATTPPIVGQAFVTVTGGFTYANTFVPPSAGSEMTTRRIDHALTRTYGDLVLASGGLSAGVASNKLEIFNPSGQFWSQSGVTLATARSRHSATLLPTGRILIVGGRSASGTPLASAEIYDPFFDTIAPAAGGLSTAREDHTATLMQDGRVLIAGGRGAAGTLNSLEIFNPATGTFTPFGTAMVDARVGHTAEVLLDGRVFLGGGSKDGTDSNLSNTASLFNPFTGALTTAAGLMNAGRRNMGAALAPNGLLSLLGGVFTPSVPLVNQGGQRFDPATGTFSSLTSSMSAPRNRPLISILADGRALVFGGSTDLGATGDVSGTATSGTFDVYNPSTTAFPGFATNTPPVGADQLTGRCMLLYTGGVLIVGDANNGAGVPVGSVVYQ